MICILLLAGCIENTKQNTRPIFEPEWFLADGNKSIVWLVQPELEYNSIRRCFFIKCDAFLDGEDWSVAIDTQTGLPKENPHGCAGAGPSDSWIALFVYDPQRNLFGQPGRGYRPGRRMMPMMGLHPLEELMGDDECRFRMFGFGGSPLDGFIAVESVDSSLRETFESVDYSLLEIFDSVDYHLRETFGNDRDGVFFLTPEAHSGKFALMYNGVFVTDFIFERAIKLNVSLFAVRIGERWGAIDRNGELALPFVFDAFFPIDQYTAFAKYDGAYGILDLR